MARFAKTVVSIEPHCETQFFCFVHLCTTAKKRQSFRQCSSINDLFKLIVQEEGVFGTYRNFFFYCMHCRVVAGVKRIDVCNVFHLLLQWNASGHLAGDSIKAHYIIDDAIVPLSCPTLNPPIGKLYRKHWLKLLIKTYHHTEFNNNIFLSEECEHKIIICENIPNMLIAHSFLMHPGGAAFHGGRVRRLYHLCLTRHQDRRWRSWYAQTFVSNLIVLFPCKMIITITLPVSFYCFIK